MEGRHLRKDSYDEIWYTVKEIEPDVKLDFQIVVVHKNYLRMAGYTRNFASSFGAFSLSQAFISFPRPARPWKVSGFSKSMFRISSLLKIDSGVIPRRTPGILRSFQRAIILSIPSSFQEDVMMTPAPVASTTIFRFSTACACDYHFATAKLIIFLRMSENSVNLQLHNIIHMKAISLILPIIMATSCTGTGDTLVAYFSATGTTKAVAERIAGACGADLFEIQPATPYTDADLNWRDKQSRSSLEMADRTSRPAIAAKVKGIEKYNTVYIGFPIWWYTAPTIINTFIEENDLSGKRIVLFATSGGSDITGAIKDFKQAYPQLNWDGGQLLNHASDEQIAAFVAPKEAVSDADTFPAPDGGEVVLTPINHGSLALSYKGFEIQVDPVGNFYGNPIDYSAFPKADLILVTHEHGDHLDPAIIAELSTEGTRVICNAASAGQLPAAEVMANGESKEINGISVKAVPAYNCTEGHTQFHPQGNGNGYLLSIGGLNIYIAGDTEDIPELAELKDIDVALLPANQPYTMTVEQCIKAAKTISPKVLIPYHLGETDVQAIKDGLEGTGIKVILHEKLR